MPGFLFSAFLLFAIVVPLVALIWQISGYQVVPPGASISNEVIYITADVRHFIDSFRFEILIAIAAFSYVIGHIFFRQDPKLPDVVSYWRLPDAEKETGAVRILAAKSKNMEPKVLPPGIFCRAIKHCKDSFFI